MYADRSDQHWAGHPVITNENREQIERLKAQRREEYRKRIPIESKFGQGKNGLNYIRAKPAQHPVPR